VNASPAFVKSTRDHVMSQQAKPQMIARELIV
jgi:hypothetical protein